MSVVRDFCGHGLGRLFHDEPNIIHVGRPGEGVMLKPGMFFTIEPMINLGKPHVKILSDGWTAVTRDRSLSAQFEHSVGVTADGVEIFTLSARNGEKPPYGGLAVWRGGLASPECRRPDTSELQKRSGTAIVRPDACQRQALPGSTRRGRRIITAIANGCASASTRAGPEALSDYELLEMALFPALPRRDTKPLAKALLEEIRLVRRSRFTPRSRACARSTASARPRSTRSNCSPPPRAGWPRARSGARSRCRPGTR